MKEYIAGIIELLYSGDAAVFMKALLLGDKTEFYSSAVMYVNMSRAGIMHTVAVSGMHVSFVVGFVRLLFGNSRRSSLICLLFLWLFVAMTGFTPSAMRAAFMQTTLLLAPFFRRENDSLRSLIFAALIILIIDFTAITNISFQLSFGAMAGITLFANPIYIRLSEKLPAGRFLSYLIGIVSSSVAVMIITIPVTAYHFGSVQLLSPLTNLLVLWAVSVAFILGYVSVFTAFLSPFLAKPFVFIVTLCIKYINSVAGFVSSLSFSSLSIKSEFILIWIILVYALFIGAFFLKKRYILPAVLSLASLAVLFAAARISEENLDGSFSVIDVGQGQCIAAVSGDSTVLIDCGNTGISGNAGHAAAEYLLSYGRNSVDYLILTHLHEDHVSGIPVLMELTDVGTILIPDDVPDDDCRLEEIMDCADRHGTNIFYIHGLENFSSGGIDISLLPPTESGDANERCMSVIAGIGKRRILITGDAGKSTERELAESYDLSGIDFIVAGHHGSKYSVSEELLNETGSHTAIISTGANSYGHPTYETLSLLSEKGFDIYRTDLNGTVRIRIYD